MYNWTFRSSLFEDTSPRSPSTHLFCLAGLVQHDSNHVAVTAPARGGGAARGHVRPSTGNQWSAKFFWKFWWGKRRQGIKFDTRWQQR